jgi:hypothetical protein
MVFIDQKELAKALITGDFIYTKPAQIMENILTKRP